MFVLLFSLVAYFGAILAKVVVQYLTYRPPFFPASGGNPFELGAYFGLQTVFFEVGGAYLVARYAVSHGMLKANDAEGYGISLALWENGVLIGGSLLVSYAVYYATLSAGSGTAAEQMFATLIQSAPSLFDAAIERAAADRLRDTREGLVPHDPLLMGIPLRAGRGLQEAERSCSVALPMGLVDFLVPFAGSLGTGAFEGLIFAIALLCVAGTLALTRGDYRGQSTSFASPPAGGGEREREGALLHQLQEGSQASARSTW